MVASVVSICSNASLLLGGEPINDLAEDNDRTRLASNLFEPVRDFVLRRHPWNCAVKRVVLSPDVINVGLPDYANTFTLPDDFMKVLQVGEYQSEVDYRIESGKLLCDENPLYLRYVWKNTNPATWDGMLVWGMTMSMQAVMAYPITQSASMSQLVEVALRDVLKQARAVDGQDDPPETFGDSPLTQARFGSGFPSGWRR